MSNILSEIDIKKYENYFNIFNKRFDAYVNKIINGEETIKYIYYVQILLSNNVDEVIINSIMTSYESKKNAIIQDHKLYKSFNSNCKLTLNLDGYTSVKTTELSLIDQISILHQECANKIEQVINSCTFDWDKLVFKLHYYAFIGDTIEFKKNLMLLINYVKMLHGSACYRTYNLHILNILNNFKGYALLVISSPKYLKTYKYFNI